MITKRYSPQTGAYKLNRNNASRAPRRMMEHACRKMAGELAAALRALENMPPVAAVEAGRLVTDLWAVKKTIEARAGLLGYPDRCRRAIPICRGECCRWHFPKTIDRIDFFTAVIGMSANERQAVATQVNPAAERGYQCPLLRANGCLFGFNNRPLVCTSAYPCMAGDDYWRYKETFRETIDTIRIKIGRLIALTIR